MIPLVKHFLRRANPILALLVSLGAVAWFLICWIVDCSEIQQAWLPTFFIVAMYAMAMALVSEEAVEFDLVLPVPRRKLYVAKNLAMLLLIVIVEAPVGVTVLVIAALQSHHWEALRICATFAVCWIAVLLMTVPFVRLAYRTRSVFAVLIAAMPLIGISTLLIMAMWGNAPSLLTVAEAVPTAALAWFLGRRQLDRYEPAAGGDAEPAQVAAARSGLIDRLPPTVRVLAHGVWLRWRYPPLVIYVVALSFMFTATKTYDLLLCDMMVYVSIGFFILWFCGWIGQSLLPFVPRRTLLRSILGPIAAAPLLIGGVEAVVSRSGQMIVWFLVTTLMIVGITWFWLPWPKEYRRSSVPSSLWQLRNLPVICILICVFVPGARDFVRRAFSVIGTPLASWIDGKPVLVSCVIVLAIALLWWRCERKFRHFEPSAL